MRDQMLGQLSGGFPGQFRTFFVDDVALTIPDGIGLAAAHVVSDGAPVTVTLPSLGAIPTAGCIIIISAPNGAANNVTVAPRAGNTILGGASSVLNGADRAIFWGIAGNTDWKGFVVT